MNSKGKELNTELFDQCKVLIRLGGKDMTGRALPGNNSRGVAASVGPVSATLGAEGQSANRSTAPDTPPKSGACRIIGRPVRIVSIGFESSTPLAEIVRHVDEEGSRGSDVIILPELCRGQCETSEESIFGPTVTTMASLSKKYKTYIAIPIDRRDGNQRLNSVVLLDRSGQVVCVYDKVFPYWSEYDVHPAVRPGKAVQVYEADFGRLGFATCFDVNFPEVWKCLSDKGAELVIWPSAYSAGISLQAHAINHHYYVVSCSETPDCVAYDITGEQLFYARAEDINISRLTLDLDRGIYHHNFNIAKRDKLLREHSRDLVQEKCMDSEQWFVLKAKRPGVSAKELAREYGLGTC